MNKKRISIIAFAIVFAVTSLAAVISYADDNIEISATFTDPVFRDAVALHYDTDGDGFLSPDERSETAMSVGGMIEELAEIRGVDEDTLTISTLEGIECFSGLTALYCNNVGELGTLDVSALSELTILNCSDDGLTELDLSANTNLRWLHCCSNEFESLDFTANENLEHLHCYANLELRSLNVTGLENLEELRCDGCQLTELDLTTNTALYTLNCSHNNLAKIDLSNTKANSLTDYHLGNQNISLEMVYQNDRIEAPIDLNSDSVYSTTLDEDETAYADRAFFTTDYSKIRDGFSYQYSTGRSGCAEMKVNVSVYHTHTYAVTAADYENKKLTVNCRICGEDEHILDAELSTVTVSPDCTNPGSITHTLTAEFDSKPYTNSEVTNVPALGHNYGTVVTAPTCTEQGYTTYTCTRCPDTYVDDYTDALGHNYSTVVTEPTCTEQGYTTYTCTRCPDTYVDDYTDALGHTNGTPVIENNVPATCTAGGTYDEVVYCTVCTAEISRTPKTTDALGHNFGAWTETTAAVAPTCTTEGSTAVETRYCSRCDAFETQGGEKVDALGHNYGSVVTAPTCTEQGYTTYTCTRCPDTYVDDYTDALGHNYGTVVTDPTCTEQGYTTYICTRCSDTYVDDYTDALGHTNGTPVIENNVSATCTAGGTYDEVVYCTVCTAELSRTPKTTDALGHNFGAWTETTAAVAPTCTADGSTAIETRYCSRCDAFETQGGDKVNALGHTEETIPAVAPTCTETGLTAGVKCSVCDTILTEQQTVNKLGHNYSEVVTEPTCTEQGYTTHTCTRCNDSFVDTYTDAKGHTPGDAVKENEVPATCTEGGTYDEVVYCTVCTAELSRTPRTTEALGHSEETIPAVAPTCTKKGLTAGVKCSRCGEILTAQESVDALGHTWDKGTVTVEPTVENEGKKKFTCTVCGATRTESIPKLTVAEVTPTESEGDNAKVNKKIKKPNKIHTISYSKKKQLYIYFTPVKGAQNYRIMYRKQGAKKWNKAWTNGKAEYTIKNLKANGLYEFKFAAYKKNANGKWERGEYSTTSYRYYFKETITKVTVKKQSVTIKWKRDKSAHYYKIEYATNKDMKNSKTITNISPNSKTSYTIKNLKKGKKYYIRVRAIKKKAGKDYIGEYSNKKTFTIK